MPARLPASPGQRLILPRCGMHPPPTALVRDQGQAAVKEKQPLEPGDLVQPRELVPCAEGGGKDVAGGTGRVEVGKGAKIFRTGVHRAPELSQARTSPQHRSLCTLSSG